MDGTGQLLRSQTAGLEAFDALFGDPTMI